MATIGSNATITDKSFYVNDSTDNVGNAIRNISYKNASSAPAESASPSTSVTFSQLLQANLDVSQVQRELERETQKIQNLRQAIEAAQQIREQLESQRDSAEKIQANVQQDSVIESLKQE